MRARCFKRHACNDEMHVPPSPPSPCQEENIRKSTVLAGGAQRVSNPRKLKKMSKKEKGKLVKI